MRVGQEVKESKSKTMGSHHSSKMLSDTWLTPLYVIRPLGHFDLDPCCPEDMPWRTAETMLTKNEDGLKTPWHGRVWLNPPYSREATVWLEKLADHGTGTALVFARTETSWFVKSIWKRATAILFIEGRLYFHRSDGSKAPANAGAPSCLVAYGDADAEALRNHPEVKGTFIRLKSSEPMQLIEALAEKMTTK